MSKRQFRSRGQVQGTPQTADYPTSDGFETDRRAFLVKLGGVLLGAGALAACGSRPVKSTPEPDIGGPAVVAPQPDGAPFNDGGAAPMPDAGIDGYNGPAGVAPEPDAQIDKMDAGMGGVPRAPDAQIDEQDLDPSPGFAPSPDAAVDGGSCPNP